MKTRVPRNPKYKPDDVTARVLRIGCQFLDAMEAWIHPLAQIKLVLECPEWELIYRAAVVRQFASARTIIDLGYRAEGERSVALVRRAVEELIWLRYLERIKTVSCDGLSCRDLLLVCKRTEEVCRSVEAQWKYAGDDVMSEWGFSASFQHAVQIDYQSTGDILKKLAELLDWRKKNRHSFPSTYEMAAQVDRKDLYDVIFHGTSRCVHFSPFELLRWSIPPPGTPLKTISDIIMAPFWTKFSVIWGCHILLDTFRVVADAFTGAARYQINEPLGFKKAYKALSSLGAFPIVSSEEFVDRFPTESGLLM